MFARIYGVPLLGQVLGVLPEISRIQFYRYGTAALELPVILLAALGLDDLARVPAHRRRLVWGALAAIAVLAVAALSARPIVAFPRDAVPASRVLPRLDHLGDRTRWWRRAPSRSSVARGRARHSSR